MGDGFGWARMGAASGVAGDDARAMVDFLSRHGREEAEMLERYQRFAEHAASPETRQLVSLIMKDEQRHHQELVEMANAVGWGMLDTGDSPVLPDLSRFDAGDEALARETEDLLATERRDREELKQLRRRLRAYTNATRWQLMVDLMLLDTDKHIRILETVAKNTQADRVP